ncbi:hypothetical protein H6A07_04505 [Olsenella uli]|uniref:hypothetical protein n=1 Tax=Olsenella uli TaxID=133926 RepID=UPI0019588554|nr:hypothetical protein [Olsenella uli]MBM6676003.1 hypothetical protein [Olsenella uli]
MRLCVCKLTALRALRQLRSSSARLPEARCDLPVPDPSPACRWTSRLVPVERLALDERPSAERRIDVAVPTRDARIQAGFVANALHSRGYPAGSFVDLGDGLVIPCPELLFLELAGVLMQDTLALLAYELCGTFSRDARDPRLGPVTYDVEPVTSVARIATYLDSCPGVRGVAEARRALARAADNAWSAPESVIALMATTPIERFGYGLGRVRLNRRRANDRGLVALGTRASRVPDIEIAGTSVGLNYDGHDHLDLASIAEATPEDVSEAMAAVRGKYRDDLSRNRELAAQGRIVLPVTSEDLFAPGGLDAVMLEAMMVAGRIDGRRMAELDCMLLESDTLSVVRQLTIWALLPWPQGARYAAELVRLRGGRNDPEVHDEVIKF